jgi:hypothetical protein
MGGSLSWGTSRTGFSLSVFEFQVCGKNSKEDRLKPVLLELSAREDEEGRCEQKEHYYA